MSTDTNSELESFRRQWQEEVSRRRDVQPRQSGKTNTRHARTGSKDTSLASHHGAPSSSRANQEQDGNYGTYDFDDMEAREESKKLGTSGSGVRPEMIANRDPISALDHYEMAVVRETEGKLGESLDLYRKAFRLDDCVDQIYKRKHFPASSFKPKPKEVRSTSPEAKVKGQMSASPTVSALVASFIDAKIEGALPIISGDVSPPCPIKNLPSELLVGILDQVAKADVAALSRLASVSKRFAYLIATEDSIWRRLVHGPRFGLGGMHHGFAKEISGAPLELSLADLSLTQKSKAPRILPMLLPLNTAYPTYRHMYQHRPRIRFSGVYISTVNYTRPGASGPNTLTWNTPIHVVTYYRYLRFYRDGSCISLLTTTEPLDVVPYLQKENLGTEFVATTTLPVGVMRDARRGRWKLSAPHELTDYEKKKQGDLVPEPKPETETDQNGSAQNTTTGQTDSAANPQHADNTAATNKGNSGISGIEPEGILSIETEGPTKTYHYTARFELQSSGKASSAPRNTKLLWRGFWSYNVISGDWGEFGLKHDRAFVWSRVKSWADA